MLMSLESAQDKAFMYPAVYPVAPISSFPDAPGDADSPDAEAGRTIVDAHSLPA